jgi:hypothetical protein
VTWKIRCDDTIAFERLRENVLPVITGTGESVKEEERFAGAGIVTEQCHAPIVQFRPRKKQTVSDL